MSFFSKLKRCACMSASIILGVLIVSNVAQSKTLELVASDAAKYDELGHAVAINERFTVVSAKLHDNRSTNDGAVYVYTRDGNEYQQIKPTGLAKNSYFGNAIALNDNWLFVAAEGDDSKANNAGAIFVYSWETTGSACDNYAEGCWVFSQKLIASDGASNDNFGASLSFSNGFLAVGSPDFSRGRKGKVYMFSNAGNQWAEAQAIELPNVNYRSWNTENFGSTVSIDGANLIVGAPNSDLRSTNAGAVYAFSYDGAAWNYNQLITPGDIQGGDYFGSAVVLDGDRLVVGATGSDDEFYNRGALYVYMKEPVSGNWVMSQRLLDSNGNALDYLGGTIALESNLIAVSATGDYAGAGSVVLFQIIDDQWEQVGRSTKLVGKYGAAIDIDGFDLVIGAPKSDVAKINAGAVIVVDIIETLMESIANEYSLPAVAVGIISKGELIKNSVIGTRKIGLGSVDAEVGDMWHVGSVTKSTVAMMVSRVLASDVAKAEGSPIALEKLTWDTALEEIYPVYFTGPDSVNHAYRQVTLRNLLSHTAGLAPEDGVCYSAGVEDDADMEGMINFMRSVLITVKKCPDEYEGGRTESYMRAVLARDVVDRPDGLTYFKDFYANNGFVIATKILEDWTGVNYQALVDAYLFNFNDASIDHAYGDWSPVDRGYAVDDAYSQPWGHVFSVVPFPPEFVTPLALPNLVTPAGGLILSIESWSELLIDQRGGLLKNDDIYTAIHQVVPAAQYEALQCKAEGNCVAAEFTQAKKYLDTLNSAHFAMGWMIYDHPTFGITHAHSGSVWFGSANQFLFLDEEKGYDFGVVMATNTDTSIVKQQEWDLDLALSLVTYVKNLKSIRN